MSENILSMVQTSSVKLVRFLYCDTSSIIRGKVTNADKLKTRLTDGIGLVKGMMAMNMLDQLQVDTGLGGTGEIRLVPDQDTFTLLPYASNSALMICDMVELDQTPWDICPRSALVRQINKAAEMGFEIQAAFEPEFMVGTEDESENFIPIDQSLCFSTDGMNRGDAFISRFMDALQRQSIPVEQYYPELGHGQHELSVSHAPALAAADRNILYRETLRGVSQSMGLVATLAPKPVAEQAGNGCHLHISAWDKTSKQNLFGDGDELSEFGQHFVAGLLKNLPAIVAITCASVNSYRRLKPRSWSSAFTCWGYENREAAIRVPTTYWSDREATTNIEIKCVDSSCNPYLAIAVVIAAGMEGVKQKMTPPDPLTVDPASLNSDEMAKNHVQRLPGSLKEAVNKMIHSRLLKDTLGDHLYSTYITVKNSEVSAFAKNSVDFELKTHRKKF